MGFFFFFEIFVSCLVDTILYNLQVYNAVIHNFFLTMPAHVEVPGLGIKPAPSCYSDNTGSLACCATIHNFFFFFFLSFCFF